MQEDEFNPHEQNIMKLGRLLFASNHDHEEIRNLMEKVPVKTLDKGFLSINALVCACYSECMECVRLLFNYGMDISKVIQDLKNDPFLPPQDIEILKSYQYLCQVQSLQKTIPFLVGLRQATGILPTFTKHAQSTCFCSSSVYSPLN